MYYQFAYVYMYYWLEMLTGKSGTTGDLVRLRMAVFLTSRNPLMPRKLNRWLYQKSEACSWCCGKLTLGLRYARKAKSLTRVSQLYLRVEKCVHIDLSSMEMRKKCQKPPQETLMGRCWTSMNRGITRRCNYQNHFDQVNLTISEYVIRHLMGLFHVCYGKWCKGV